MLGCFGNVPKTNINNNDSCNVDIELKGDGAFDIYENAPIIAYL
jgi:hypothetical protein